MSKQNLWKLLFPWNNLICIIGANTFSFNSNRKQNASFLRNFTFLVVLTHGNKVAYDLSNAIQSIK